MNLAFEITTLLKQVTYCKLNVKFSSMQEGLKDMSEEYQIEAFKDLVYPACLVMSNIDYEYKDVRYVSKFDLKLYIFQRSDVNMSIEDCENDTIENVLMPLKKEIETLIKSSKTIICDHLINTAWKIRYKVMAGSEVCDIIELNIKDLKLFNPNYRL
jgi:hypothetical protein